MPVVMLCSSCRAPIPCSCHKGNTAKRYGSRWRRFRLAFYREQYPDRKAHPDIPAALCVRCYQAGKIVSARDLDHVIPLRDDVRSDADPRMYEGLFDGYCQPHHAEKTRKEQYGM